MPRPRRKTELPTEASEPAAETAEGEGPAEPTLEQPAEPEQTEEQTQPEELTPAPAPVRASRRNTRAVAVAAQSEEPVVEEPAESPTEPQPASRFTRVRAAPVSRGQTQVPQVRTLPSQEQTSQEQTVAPSRTSIPTSLGPATAHIPTGIVGLDDLVEGGFEQGSSVLVTGDPGAGKTTFLMQFIYEGATKHKEPGVFITFEDRREDLIRHMKAYGWDLAKLEKDRLLIILDYPPHEIERFLTEGEILHDTILNLGAKRVAIDSLSTFALIFESEYKLRLGILKVLDQFKKWGTTVLASGEGRMNDRGEVEDRFGLEHLVDGFVYLYNLRRGERRERALEVIELKGIKHSTVVHPLLFERSGLRVEH